MTDPPAALHALLREATGVAASGRHPHVRLDATIGTRSLQRAALEWREGRLVLAAWPGELKAEAQALYGTDRASRLTSLRGWHVTPRPHLGFYGASPPQRLYTTSALDVDAYVRSWREDVDRVHAYELGELRDVLWPWLVARGYASPRDAVRIPRFERLVGRRTIHLRPAVRVERPVAANADDVRAALAGLLVALDEPPLPVASPA
ncbi:MAG TPA: hypothetical protein VJT75_15815 [Thermoleophilaceae bacterium]|nr:hypothetical protein [Thermoleophilaceae bacterium]